ncbi:type VI secretion system baseplate subunit TssG [Aureimonas leprariae]|uniref:Type VI secretion system baseplate subunit TssG n=1 Tax=Plantimonas leprariae TaxID=2615207 RepID=A0A7V7PQ75_9HYPH|nr:type VI secretion system baseplate subunit TssG [Aureimonas leprariae]KAB0680237.1 type VI secretion system baseplate subunit TssG [Aureimonas leprariae]
MSALLKDEPEATADALVERLLAEPHQFEASTALRVAERSGLAVDVEADASLALAPAAISQAKRGANGRLALRTPLSGLVGAFGALPPAYTEILLGERRRRSKSLAAFLDLFGDRLFRLFAASLEKYRLARLVRWEGVGGGNRIAGALLALAGLRTERLRDLNRAVGDEAVLRHAGFFANRTRNAASLAAMLSADSGLPVAVEQFRGRWLSVAPAEQTRLGGGARLGVDAMAGAKIKDHSGAFRVAIGPVGYLDYLSLEPRSPRIERLIALARLYAGPGLAFDVQVILRKGDVPECRLGDPAHPAKLGWNTWARSLPLSEDSGDAVIPAR